MLTETGFDAGVRTARVLTGPQSRFSPATTSYSNCVFEVDLTLSSYLVNDLQLGVLVDVLR